MTVSPLHLAPHLAPRSLPALGVPIRLAAALLAACGGGSSETRVHTNGADSAPTATATRTPETLASHVTVDMSVGQLILGAASDDSADVILALEAVRGRLVLTGCDWLEAGSSAEGVTLGNVQYRATNTAERLYGTFPRALLRRLFRANRVRFNTCDEEVQVPARSMEAVRRFLSGQGPAPHEDVDTRMLAMEGLRMVFRTRSLSPDVVEIDLDLIEPSISEEDCMAVVAMVDGQTYLLADLVPADPDIDVDHTRVVGNTVKVNAQILAHATDATLVVCGDPWPLDRWSLENLSTLVGRPPPDAQIVRPDPR